VCGRPHAGSGCPSCGCVCFCCVLVLVTMSMHVYACGVRGLFRAGVSSGGCACACVCCMRRPGVVCCSAVRLSSFDAVFGPSVGGIECACSWLCVMWSSPESTGCRPSRAVRVCVRVWDTGEGDAVEVRSAGYRERCACVGASKSKLS